MQLVIGALLRALPGIGNVGFVIGLIWLIFRHVACMFYLIIHNQFSILGVQLFGGKFSRCVNAQMAAYSPDDVPNKEVCLNTTGNVWWTPPANFDNSGLGLVALFQVCASLTVVVE
jgi:voltage-gated sodium channel type II alpha